MTRQKMLIGTRNRYAFVGIKKALVEHLFDLCFDCFRHNTNILDVITHQIVFETIQTLNLKMAG